VLVRGARRARGLRAAGSARHGRDRAREERLRFADGHSRRGRPVPHWHFDALAGAGALRSTVDDLLTFLAFQLDPPDSPLGAAARVTQAERAGRGRLAVGLGWMRVPLRRGAGDMVWHNGGTGGFRSYAGFVREEGAGVVVLSNSARSVDTIGLRILEAACEHTPPRLGG
jgi:serine-type D-Ala-D-Ala carboxypeptidase/endopeptidase